MHYNHISTFLNFMIDMKRLTEQWKMEFWRWVSRFVHACTWACGGIVVIRMLCAQLCVCMCTLLRWRVFTQSDWSRGTVWRGDSAFSPEASITIHYYSALPVCKCFLTTRDSQPARFPRSPSAEADEPDCTVNARVGKKAHHRNMFFPLTCPS